ncbi:Integrase catalytic subunit [Calderihabitans maritimus]|uniref:Integrase catalytic subunit n=1 Tax=Calderihabitans maritimus TaxID=1246530 RepID=A0A1Z5HS86_9FIRM|nr:Integrase catalytic subunit [Calderihabitans maritimus]
MERSASEPGLAFQVGNLAKSGKARKLDNLRSLDGRVHVQAGRLNWGSSVPSKLNLVSSNKPEGEGEKKWCRVADESVVVMNLQPMKAGNVPYSNAGFCVPVPSENTQCFLRAMIQVFEWIGGVPQRIRFDNLPAAVVHIGKEEERKLTETFSRFMLHYRFEPEFCNKGMQGPKTWSSASDLPGYSL